MKRWFKYAAGLTALAGMATLFTGCPQGPTPKQPPVHKLGNTQPAPLSPEQLKAATQVAVSLTDSGIKVTPDKAPSGPMVITVTNNCKADKQFIFTGASMKPESQTLKVKDKGTVTLYSAKPGNYSVIIPAAKKGEKATVATLTVGGASPSTGKAPETKPGSAMPVPMPKPANPPATTVPTPPTKK